MLCHFLVPCWCNSCSCHASGSHTQAQMRKELPHLSELKHLISALKPLWDSSIDVSSGCQFCCVVQRLCDGHKWSLGTTEGLALSRFLDIYCGSYF